MLVKQTQNLPLYILFGVLISPYAEFLDECRDLLLSHGVKIQYANSKRSVAIAERDHQEFEKHTYFWQNAEDFYLPLTNRSRAWVKGLCINDDIYNNTPTWLIGMSPNEAVKKALKEPDELEGGRRRATDCNWSPEVFTIDSYLIKENQPILYKLYKGLRCSFVREELQIVKDVQLPPQWILKY
ncbi:hypothetical protein RIR_jg7317.t1 [Rhizophagus irregularis DAOM 181602=DAOM 197198]|nr:hypothetical protein RIR_jg7317.t1 [Rhizophagus irregularis DAOM 181602=DAOM 197198]